MWNMSGMMPSMVYLGINEPNLKQIMITHNLKATVPHAPPPCTNKKGGQLKTIP